jgi:IS30 family transposase
VDIECRPKAVDGRLHLGHWEGDTVLHGHKNSCAVTLVERRSGYLLADCVPKLKAGLVSEVIGVCQPRHDVLTYPSQQPRLC